MKELTLETIGGVLDARIRPALQSHGGDVLVEELKDDVLYVRLLGACHGCPSASITMGNFVEEELKKEFPSLREVALVQGVSDELMEQARRIMASRWEA